MRNIIAIILISLSPILCFAQYSDKEMYQAYKDEVERLDKGLGLLFAGLKERGLWDKVQIIFTADHGEEFADHGYFFHGTSLYEEQLKVPLIIFGQDIAAGRQPAMARQVDILPTICALNNLPINPKLVGMDLLSGTVPTLHLAEEDHQGHELVAIITLSWAVSFLLPDCQAVENLRLWITS